MTIIASAPARPRPTILLTGFGPFPDVPENASARLVTNAIAVARARFPECAIEFEVLPTEWRAGPERLLQAIDHHRPDVLLCFGVARDIRGFRLETQALNGCRQAPDARGDGPEGETLCQGGPQSIAATAPLSAIAERLAAKGIECAMSEDAGGYLCNAVYYRALDHARSHWTIAFIHIPAVLGSDGLTLDDATEGVMQIIAACIGLSRVND